MNAKHLHGSRGGFSLVEVSLAMLVAGIGLMAVFALFPSALDAVRASGDEVRAAQFAESVFATLRASAPHRNWDNLHQQTEWNFAGWRDPGFGRLDLPDPIAVNSTPQLYTLRARDNTRIEEASFRYQVTIEADGVSDYIYQVRLNIWNNPSGPLSPTNHVFYSEIYRWSNWGN